MRKTNGLKRCFAFLVAIAMLLGCVLVNAYGADTGVTWEASNSNNTLQVKSFLTGRQYKAYQLFYGDELNDTLAQIKWGMSVNEPAKIIEALKAPTLKDGRTNTIQSKFADLDNNASASDLSAAIYDIGDRSDEADVFAYIVLNALKDQSGTVEYKEAKDAIQINASDATKGYHYSFGNLHDGYYLVEETTDITSKETASRIMVRVQGPTTIITKAEEAPTIDKNIVKADGTTAKYDDVAIGDTVTFQLKSEVPNMSGYNKYFFIMTDVLSKGLTYTKADDNMKITINGTELVEDTDYYVKDPVTDETTGETTVQIVFVNFIKHKNLEDKPIIVTYDAKVNDQVTIGKTTANFNKVKLTYSNNPNVSYVGQSKDNPENPGDEPKTGENANLGSTEYSTVYVYTTGLNIIKVKKGFDTRLTGAVFTITGDAVNQVIKTSYTFTPSSYYTDGDADVIEGDNEFYVKKSDGNFEKNTTDMVAEIVKYSAQSDDSKDVNGTYYKNITDPANPVWETSMSSDATYETGYVIYEREENKEIITNASTETWTGTVGDNGELYIAGIPAGEYKITEIKAPYGYNLLENPISMKIECEVDTTNMEPTWKFSFDKSGGTDYTADDQKVLDTGIKNLRIENAAGTTLPSTGGIGTTIFYLVGSILLIGAAILLVTKRRMENERG
jgi:fimbrial isopeptide formation D2 family protein/LPXTG-motif cell wall-anchored protein